MRTRTDQPGLVSDKAAPAESAAIISGSAKAAVPAAAANETAPEIDLGRFDSILAAQIAQQCVDALVIALDCCARSMQLQDVDRTFSVVIGMLWSFFAMQPRSERKAGIRKRRVAETLYPFYCSDNMSSLPRRCDGPRPGRLWPTSNTTGSGNAH